MSIYQAWALMLQVGRVWASILLTVLLTEVKRCLRCGFICWIALCLHVYTTYLQSQIMRLQAMLHPVIWAILRGAPDQSLSLSIIDIEMCQTSREKIWSISEASANLKYRVSCRGSYMDPNGQIIQPTAVAGYLKSLATPADMFQGSVGAASEG